MNYLLFSAKNITAIVTGLILLFLLIGISSCSSDAGPVPVIRLSGTVVDEGNAANRVEVEAILSVASESSVSFDVSTSDESAIAGEDYQPLIANKIVFNSGQLVATFSVDLIGDTAFEMDEFFYLNLTNVDGATLQVDRVQFIIVNDDIEPINTSLAGPESPMAYDGMTLLWQDEFNDSELNTLVWTQEFGDNWFNNELQTYTNQDRNILFQDGKLILEARREKSPYGGGNPYTSARLITQNKFNFTYGRVDIRASMPEGQGIWPALWTLGDNISSVGWPACGEIDILEMIGGTENIAHNAIHWDGVSGNQSVGTSYEVPGDPLNDAYHVYSLIWTPTNLTWLLDDVVRDVKDITSDDMTEFHLPQFLIFNIAVGGDWPGNPDATTVFPQRMIVDYVRVFQ